MAELLSDSEWQSIKIDLGRRVREIRVALYGENGGPLLAEALKVPYPNLARLRKRLHHPRRIDPSLHRIDRSSPPLALDRRRRTIPRSRLTLLSENRLMASIGNLGVKVPPGRRLWHWDRRPGQPARGRACESPRSGPGGARPCWRRTGKGRRHALHRWKRRNAGRAARRLRGRRGRRRSA